MNKLLPGILVGLWLLVPSLLLPFRLDALETFSTEIENRHPAELPELASASELLSQAWYTELDGFLSDRVPLRDLAIPAKANLDYFVLRKSELNGVDRGRNGWLFAHSSLHLGYAEPDAALKGVRQLQTSLRAYAASTSESAGRILLVIAPDKASIYPEELAPHSRRAYERFLPARELLHEVITQTAGLESIDVWALYTDLKSKAAEAVYYARDTHHTRVASGELVKAILNRLTGGSAWPGPATLPTGDSKERLGDLSKKAGLVNFVDHVPVRSVPKRDTVTYSLRLVHGGRLDPGSEADWIGTDAIRALTRAGQDPVIGGRTLILHDSFLAGNREVLASFFEDVTLQSWRGMTACRFRRARITYDRIVLETAERRAGVQGALLSRLGTCRDRVGSSSQLSLGGSTS